MKGNPALRTTLILLLLAALAYPVSRVISRNGHDAPSPSQPVSAPEPACLTGTLLVRTAPAPIRLEVTSGGKIVLGSNETAGRSESSKEVSLLRGNDLVIRAQWSDEHPHALHAEFLSSGTNAPVSRDYWTGHTLEDVLSLQ